MKVRPWLFLVFAATVALAVACGGATTGLAGDPGSNDETFDGGSGSTSSVADGSSARDATTGSSSIGSFRNGTIDTSNSPADGGGDGGASSSTSDAGTSGSDAGLPVDGGMEGGATTGSGAVWIQSASFGMTTIDASGTVITSSALFASNVTQGDLVVVTIQLKGTFCVVMDSNGIVYRQVTTNEEGTPGVGFFYAIASVSGPLSIGVFANSQPAHDVPSLALHGVALEYSGVNTYLGSKLTTYEAEPLANTPNPFTTAAITTTSPNELLVAVAAAETDSLDSYPVASGAGVTGRYSFTQTEVDGSEGSPYSGQAWYLTVADEPVATAGTYSFDFDFSATHAGNYCEPCGTAVYAFGWVDPSELVGDVDGGGTSALGGVSWVQTAPFGGLPVIDDGYPDYSATFERSVTAGDLIVVAYAWSSIMDPPELTDSLGTAYARAVTLPGSGSDTLLVVDYGLAASTGPLKVSLLNYLGGLYPVGAAIEYSGVTSLEATTNNISAANITTASIGPTFGSGSITTTSNDVLLGIGGVGAPVISEGNGFNARYLSNIVGSSSRTLQNGFAIEDTIAPAGTYSASFGANWAAYCNASAWNATTCSTPEWDYAAAIVAFH